VVRDALVVECPAGLLAVVRERDVPQQGRVDGGLQVTFLSQRPNAQLHRHQKERSDGASAGASLLGRVSLPRADSAPF
jgi:hypothetical protein